MIAFGMLIIAILSFPKRK
nr:putative holin-like toxin [Brevibacillus laterosporus]